MNPNLAAHADRLLTGTGLTAATATAAATGDVPAPVPAAVLAALRDGWAVATGSGQS